MGKEVFQGCSDDAVLTAPFGIATASASRSFSRMEDFMESKVTSRSTTPSRIDRRTILKGAATGVAATTLGTVSKRSTFAAPAFLQGGTIVLGVTSDDAPKIQPLLDDYQSANNVTIQVEQGPYSDFQSKLITNLTQGTGAYDVVSMDDPWMPQFAGGQFIMNLGELMDERGIESDDDFVPELIALGDIFFGGPGGATSLGWKLSGFLLGGRACGGGRGGGRPPPLGTTSSPTP